MFEIKSLSNAAMRIGDYDIAPLTTISVPLLPQDIGQYVNRGLVFVTELSAEDGATSSAILLSNASASGAASARLNGGQYIWKVTGTFAGATATLQSLGPDNSTYQDVTTLTANGQALVNVGVGEVLRVLLTGGTPSAMYSTLAKVL